MGDVNEQARPARRNLILSAVALAGLAISTSARAAAADGDTPATHGFTSLHQEIVFAVPPHRVYEALLDSKQFTAITGLAATISREEGGASTMFGGRILTRNIELVPNKRIVQAWRDGSWDPGVYSLVKFELVPEGAGTKLILDHTGFAPGNFWHLDPGWYFRYWNPMKKYFAAQPK